MSIGVSCPQPNDNITVHVQGGQQTVCVCGTYSATLRFFQLLVALIRALFRWLLGLLRRKSAQLTTTVRTIRVRVVSGNITQASPTPKQATDFDISPPTSPWCCNPIQLPSGSGSGTQFTAFAWLLASTNGTTTILDGAQIVHFNAGGSGSTIDCCASCGSGPTSPWLAAELASHPRLVVAVPDGPNAGLHEATAISNLTWVATIRGVTYKVAFDSGAGLVIRGPSTSETSTSVEGAPFSAPFPGTVFGAVGDVVVTKA
jgi:hypothetical protein